MWVVGCGSSPASQLTRIFISERLSVDEGASAATPNHQLVWRAARQCCGDARGGRFRLAHTCYAQIPVDEVIPEVRTSPDNSMEEKIILGLQPGLLERRQEVKSGHSHSSTQSTGMDICLVNGEHCSSREYWPTQVLAAAETWPHRSVR